jgi:hypothetical protein
VRSDIEGRSSVRLRESPLTRIVFIDPFGGALELRDVHALAARRVSRLAPSH